MDALSDPTLTNIFFLTDWAKDTWKRVYLNVNPKKATLSYTLNRNEALKKIYPKTIANVHECSIKHPKTTSDPRSKSCSLTDTDEKERKEPKSPLGRAFNSIRFTRSGYDSGGDAEQPDTEPYLMRIVDANGKELAQLKSPQLHPLKNLSNQIKDAKQQIQNLGLPLTVEPHGSQQHSFLSTGEQVELRGLINLLCLLLFSYNIRGVVDSIVTRNFVLVDLIRESIISGVLLNPSNYQTFVATLTLTQFPVYAWIIELAAAKGVPNLIITPIIFGYLTVHLIYPVVLIQWIESNALSGSYFMIFSVGQFLKLTSFHHVMYDNRNLIKRLDEMKKSKEVILDKAAFFDINPKTFEIASKYPKNLSWQHYLRYLCAPTCCYQHVYPSTDIIRVKYCVKRFFEFIICNIILAYLIWQHMLPIAEETVPHFKNKNYLMILQATLHIAVPAAYTWLVIFYVVFHCYLNFFAELTMFADRRFYSDWWNAGDLGEYWRKWNAPIHNYLIRHIYYPCRRAGLSAPAGLLITFAVSAIFHEYIVIGIFSVVNFIAFILMMVNVPCMYIQRLLKDKISGNTNNLLFYLVYLILGQPFGILFCYYQMIEKNQQLSLEVPFPEEKYAQLQSVFNQ